MSAATMPLGIDISKTDFHVALLKSAKRSKYEHFTNDTEGFRQLSQWLEQQGMEPVHACLEATTSIYVMPWPLTCISKVIG